MKLAKPLLAVAFLATTLGAITLGNQNQDTFDLSIIVATDFYIGMKMPAHLMRLQYGGPTESLTFSILAKLRRNSDQPTTEVISEGGTAIFGDGSSMYLALPGFEGGDYHVSVPGMSFSTAMDGVEDIFQGDVSSANRSFGFTSSGPEQRTFGMPIELCTFGLLGSSDDEGATRQEYLEMKLFIVLERVED